MSHRLHSCVIIIFCKIFYSSSCKECQVLGEVRQGQAVRWGIPRRQVLGERVGFSPAESNRSSFTRLRDSETPRQAALYGEDSETQRQAALFGEDYETPRLRDRPLLPYENTRQAALPCRDREDLYSPAESRHSCLTALPLPPPLHLLPRDESEQFG